MTTWTLACSGCGHPEAQHAAVGLCPKCNQPFLAVLDGDAPSRDALLPRWDMWRYSAALPLSDGESPVSLGEGLTPLTEHPALAALVGVRRLWIKDEGVNPTASFKARGLSAAVTRAKGRGVPGVVVPTAGNAGAALAAYASAAGLPARIFAPDTTPRPILDIIRAMGVDLVTIDGHIGDCGRMSVEFAKETGYFNVATLREPYRAEGNKTLGFELAEQLGWRLPDAIVYPTGGGEGVIGMWKAFEEMRRWGWLDSAAPMPKMIVAQAAGCAPLVRAVAAGADHATPWEDPWTYASGLRVPGPLGDRLVLKTVKESAGDAEAATEEEIRDFTARLAHQTGIDAAPEGGAALFVAAKLAKAGRLSAGSEVVIYNTGSGASYRA